jgi:glycine/D-amino acid oxidase-like deaminating enzyme
MFQGLPTDDKDYELHTLQSVYQAALDTGKLDISLVDDAGILGFTSGRTIKFGQQATFHPTKYIRALAKVIKDLGGVIHETSHLNDYTDGSDGVTAVLANGSKIHAVDLVLATNVPLQKVNHAFPLS